MSGGFLLDTSTILWALANPERLSAKARKTIEAEALVVSVASYWEATVKAKTGQLLLGDPVSWWARAVQALGADVLSIRTNHVSELGGLAEHHRDPFDRMLVAQAVAEGLTIVTSDEMIHRYAVRVRW